MACFVVPAAEAVVTTIVTKVVKSKEKKENASSETKVPFSHKLSWLNTMLWGGSALLLTAMSSPESTSEMLHEMATNGVLMAVLVTAAWGVMVGVSSAIEKRTSAAVEKETA